MRTYLGNALELNIHQEHFPPVLLAVQEVLLEYLMSLFSRRANREIALLFLSRSRTTPPRFAGPNLVGRLFQTLRHDIRELF